MKTKITLLVPVVFGFLGLGLAAWAAPVVGLAPAAGPMHRYPLRMTDPTDMIQAGSRFELMRRHVQEAQEPLAIEAEHSTLLVFAEKGMGPCVDTNASGGYYAAFVRELENRIAVKTGGDYQVWYRAYFPSAGSWLHAEGMDDEPAQWVNDSAGMPVATWAWVKGPRYNLTPGEHVYRFPSPTAYCGGARLDKIILTADPRFRPEGLGPAERGLSMVREGEFVSNRFRLDDFAAWRLACEIEPNGGTVSVWFSCDRGQTWQPYAVGAPMRPVNGAKWVTFRFRLTPSAAGLSPVVKDAFLEYEPVR